MGGATLSVINYQLVRFVFVPLSRPQWCLVETWSVLSSCLVIVKLTVIFGSSMLFGLSLV
jgi:hypothetical protein